MLIDYTEKFNNRFICIYLNKFVSRIFLFPTFIKYNFIKITTNERFKQFIRLINGQLVKVGKWALAVK